MNISKLTHDSLISFFHAETQDEVLNKLIALAKKGGKIQDEAQFLAIVKTRENINSTGIGLSVAIPHAKSTAFTDFFIVIGILDKGVDWKAIDEGDVRIIFLIGGPKNKNTEYLKILSSLTSLIKNEEIRKKMLTLNSPSAMMDLLR